MWGLAAVVTLIFFKLKNSGSPRNPWQVWAAAAISMPLYYAVWWVSLYVARS